MSHSTISPAKLAANQANAQKSTGPKTGEGKATVAKNAIKSGLCSKDVLLPGESLEEFEVMKFEYLRQINPLMEGIERTLFDELTAAAWKLRRAQRVETGLLSQSDDLLAQLDDDQFQKKLENLARHKTRIERTFYRAMKELKALQTNRLEHNLFFKVQQPLPGLAELKRFAKQTQTPARPEADDSEIDPKVMQQILQQRKKTAAFARETDKMEAMLAEIRAKKDSQAA